MLGAETATNNHSATLDNGQLTTSSVPWEVVHVEPLPDYRLFVRFIDGLSGEVHLRWQIFAEKAGVFSTLRDPDVFSKVRVQDGVVTWENGLDIAPDATYYDIKRDGVQDEASYARGEIIGDLFRPPQPPPSALESPQSPPATTPARSRSPAGSASD